MKPRCQVSLNQYSLIQSKTMHSQWKLVRDTNVIIFGVMSIPQTYDQWDSTLSTAKIFTASKMASEIHIAQRILPSTFNHIHPLPHTFIHFHTCSTTFTYFQPLSTTFIHFDPFYPLSSTFIHFYPLSSTFIHFYPLLSTFIHFHPLSTTFNHFHSQEWF